MDPKVWGPKLWFSLHTMTFNYPDNPTPHHKQIYNNFFETLKFVIPCDVCSKHYTEHLKNNPIMPNLNNKESLVKWLIDLHNEVNKSLGKRIYSYSEVMKIYKESYQNKEGGSYFKKYWYTSLFVMILLLVAYTYIRCFRKRSIF